jgi:hypothetical protein
MTLLYILDNQGNNSSLIIHNSSLPIFTYQAKRSIYARLPHFSKRSKHRTTKVMAEKKEFDSIDELFKKTFEDLPEVPASSGWDTPSHRVWQQVQTGIETRHRGWSLSQQLLGLMAIGVAVSAGLYLWLATPQPVAPSAPTPVELPSTAAQAPATTAAAPVVMAPEATSTASAPASKPTHRPTVTPLTRQTESVPANQSVRPVAAPSVSETPLPKVPNSTERARIQSLKFGPWRKPLDTLPRQRTATTPKLQWRVGSDQPSGQ